MKFSTACAVLAAFAAAAAPARADPQESQVSAPVSALGNVFFRLIKAQTLIKAVEKRNYEFLSPALSNISRELSEGLNSGIFNIGIQIRMALVDVNLKVGQISGNATSIIAQIESVALTVSTLQFSDARLDYEIKRLRIKKLCEDTLAMASDVLHLIDETKGILGRNVSISLSVLQRTIDVAVKEGKDREHTKIEQHVRLINNPFVDFLGLTTFFTGYDIKQAARDLVEEGYATIQRIQDLVVSIGTYTKWLQDECQTIQDYMDKDRDTLSAINGTISGTSGSLNAIVDSFDTLFGGSGNMSITNLKDGSKALVKMMTDLRDNVYNITRNRTRRAVGSYDDTATEPYQTTTEVISLALLLEQPVKPSWLDKTPDNRCFYIYNNRTAGCIYVKTFEYMKVQYIWLLNKFIENVALFKAKEKEWNNFTTEVLNISKHSLDHSEAIKLLADWEIKKLMWSDNIKKIRDLSEKLNSYAESLFSEANAQLEITNSNDDTLNEDIMRFVVDNKKAAVNIIPKNRN